MKLHFELFLLIFYFKTTEAVKCYNCAAENTAIGDKHNCMFPNEKTQQIEGSVCLTRIVLGKTNDYYDLYREVPEMVPPMECKNETDTLKTTTECYCNTEKCNKHNLTVAGFRCYQCGYSSDGKELKVKNFTFKSDLSCSAIYKNTQTIPCTTICIEGKRTQLKEGKEVVQIFRACNDEWPTYTPEPDFDEQKHCGSPDCNKELEFVKTRCFSCGFSNSDEKLSLGDVQYKRDENCMNPDGSSDKIIPCMSKCIEVQNRNEDEVSIIRECTDKFDKKQLDTSAWSNVHYCDGENCNTEYTYSDNGSFDCYYCVYHTQGKDVTVDNVTFKHSDNCLYPKEGTNKMGHYTKCTEAYQEFEVENEKSEFVVLRKGDGVFGSEWMTTRECKTSLCNMQYPGFPVPASSENYANKIRTSFVLFVLSLFEITSLKYELSF